MERVEILLIILLVITIIKYLLNDNEHLTINSNSKKSFIIGKCNCDKSIEMYNPDHLCQHTYSCPWWNSTRHTRNSSWDIRGDIPIDIYNIQNI